ncbi:uncharacterized protein [Amphiura filiformis]|uniref:uncharacterized protein n=1 Tax=Amphiura filiformis TaxID=82378 RepID=UPI003B2227AF
MQSVGVFLLCIVVAVSMEQALAWKFCIHCCGNRDIFTIRGEININIESGSGKRSVMMDNEKEYEFAEWLRNEATMADIIGLLDTNCDGFVDGKEWHDQRWTTPGVASDFAEALDQFDTNGDDMLTAAEVSMAPMEVEEVDEFMVMPMEMFNDMSMRLGEGNNNPRPQGPKGRKDPDDDE